MRQSDSIGIGRGCGPARKGETMNKNERALQQFIHRRERVRCQLKALDGLMNGVEDNFSPDEISYGHVGDLEYTEQKLEEVLNFLTRQSWDSESEA